MGDESKFAESDYLSIVPLGEGRYYFYARCSGGCDIKEEGVVSDCEDRDWARSKVWEALFDEGWGRANTPLHPAGEGEEVLFDGGWGRANTDWQTRLALRKMPKCYKCVHEERERQLKARVSEEIGNLKGGEDFEDWICRHLSSDERLHAQKTPPGKDGGADIIVSYIPAESRPTKICIQAKFRKSGTVGIAAVYEVLGGTKSHNCKMGAVVTNAFFTKEAVKFARTVRRNPEPVLLIPGIELYRFPRLISSLCRKRCLLERRRRNLRWLVPDTALARHNQGIAPPQ